MLCDRMAEVMQRVLERLWWHLRDYEFTSVFPELADGSHARPNVQRFISRELPPWNGLPLETAEHFRMVLGFVDNVAPDRAHMVVKLMLYAGSPSNAGVNLGRIADVLRRAGVVAADGTVLDDKGFSRLLGRELPHGWGANGAAGTMAHIQVCQLIDPQVIGEVEFSLAGGFIDIRVREGSFRQAAERLGFDPALNKEVRLIEVKTKERRDGAVEALEQTQVDRMINDDPDRSCFVINGASVPAGRDVRMVAKSVGLQCESGDIAIAAGAQDTIPQLRAAMAPLVPQGQTLRQYLAAIENFDDGAFDREPGARRLREFFFTCTTEQLGLGETVRPFGAERPSAVPASLPSSAPPTSAPSSGSLTPPP